VIQAVFIGVRERRKMRFFPYNYGTELSHKFNAFIGEFNQVIGDLVNVFSS
jgi:hypothetical protein